jgi:hypothetical protein
MESDLPKWRWIEGKVDKGDDHLELRYGNVQNSSYDDWVPVALVGKPQQSTFIVQWIIDNKGGNNKAIIEDARSELDFYLVNKMEHKPWAYAIYHCGTSANVYSLVHWSYFPKDKSMDHHQD